MIVTDQLQDTQSTSDELNMDVIPALSPFEDTLNCICAVCPHTNLPSGVCACNVVLQTLQPPVLWVHIISQPSVLWNPAFIMCFVSETRATLNFVTGVGNGVFSCLYSMFGYQVS